MKIKNNLLFIMGILVSISIVSIAIVSDYVFTESLENKIQQNLEQNTLVIFHELSGVIKNNCETMFGLTDPSNPILHGDDFSINEKTFYLQSIDTHDNFVSYSIYDLEGNNLANTSSELFENDLIPFSSNQISSSNSFQSALDGKVDFDRIPEYSETLGLDIIKFSGPIFDENGNVAQILVGNFVSSELDTVVDNFPIHSEMEFELVSSDGTLLYSNTGNKVIPSQIEFDTQSNSDPTGNYLSKTFVSGENIITVVKTFDEHSAIDWIAASYIPTNIAYGEVKNMHFTIAVISGIILTFVFTLSFIFANSISKPITALRKATKLIQKNDYSTRITPTGNDEFVQLSHSFNTMIKSIQKQRVELKTLDKAKEEFTSMITHEIKNPLVPIVGYADMLLQENSMGNLTEKQKNAIQIILKNSLTLEQLTSDFLDVQKLELGKMNFDKKDIQNKQIIDEVYSQHQQILEKSNVEFTKIVKNIQELKLDKNRIGQIFTNLILNSVSFLPENDKKIEIGSYKQDSETIFYVKDNGCGISPDKQKQLFKKFHQIDTSKTRKHGGTGLGLSICKGIVDAHDGKIWCESKPRIGTTIFFSIPFEKQTAMVINNDKF